MVGLDFANWLLETVQFVHVNNEEDWEQGEQAEQIMRLVGIRVDSTKELKLVAVDNDVVAGALYAGWHHGEPYNGNEVMEFSFDVGVHPKYQGFPMIGPRLVDYGMKMYGQEQGEYGKYTLMRLRVVNPKLAQYLESKYQWDDSYQAGGETFLIKY